MKKLNVLWTEFKLSIDNWVGGHKRLDILAWWLVSGATLAMITLHMFLTSAQEFTIGTKLLSAVLSGPALVIEWLIFHYAGERWPNNFCTDAKKWSGND